MNFTVRVVTPFGTHVYRITGCETVRQAEEIATRDVLKDHPRFTRNHLTITTTEGV